MNELIKVSRDGSGKETVNARELHEFLISKQEFSAWIKNRIESYGFVENQDFVTNDKVIICSKKPIKEYHISLDMAKELSMVERNQKGKEARQYFIACEKIARNLETVKVFEIPTTLSSALLLASKQAEQIEAQTILLESQRPAVDFCTKMANTAGSIKIGEFAKIFSDENFVIGQNKLFQFLRDNNILMIKNVPYQKYIDNGWFEVIQGIVLNSSSGRTWSTTRITGKGQVNVARLLINGLGLGGRVAKP